MNVYESAKARIAKVFDEFDNVYVSFSGGKDSGVMLNLCIDHIRQHAPDRKLGVFHIDYEAQYQATTDYVDDELAKNQDIVEVYRVCLPVAASCGVSMHQSYWLPWEQEKRDIWVRDMPDECINESNCEFEWFTPGMWDYDLQERFCGWIHKKKAAKKTACLVGIRTQESLNRWRAINSDRNINKYAGLEWSTEMGESCFNFYPIYDWITEDVWTANGRQGYAYNKLYDLFWMAGVPIDQQRVASPFHTCGVPYLKLYKVIDPKNWGRMIGRVNGVNFAGLYGGTTAMGWRDIKLPPGHTWKTYMEFLLTTLPEEVAASYRKKLAASEKWWRDKGGCLSDEVIQQLTDAKVAFNVGDKSNYKTEKRAIRMEYLDDIDIAAFQSIPTYKRMCVCIMKNDHLCKYMGFSATKTETMRREDAQRKYSRLAESSVRSAGSTHREDQSEHVQPEQRCAA